MFSCTLDMPASKITFPWKGQTMVLRPLGPQDSRELVAAIHDSLRELRQFLPFAHHPQTVESQALRLRSMSSGQDVFMGLFAADKPRLLAVGGLHARAPLNALGTEIGFWTRTAEAGQGWATLVAQVLVVYAVEGLRMDRVQVTHNVENVRSQSVIQKCGFVLEGRLRNALTAPPQEAIAAGISTCCDALCYSLLPHEARQLPWYGALRRDLRVHDVIGDDLGRPWG